MKDSDENEIESLKIELLSWTGGSNNEIKLKDV